MSKVVNVYFYGSKGVGKKTFLEKQQKQDGKNVSFDVFGSKLISNLMFVLCDDIYKADCAIIMFSFEDKQSSEFALSTIKTLREKRCTNFPIVCLGNKVDSTKSEVSSFAMRKACKHENIKFYEISSNTLYNCEKPFVWFLNLFVGPRALFLYDICSDKMSTNYN